MSNFSNILDKIRVIIYWLQMPLLASFLYIYLRDRIEAIILHPILGVISVLGIIFACKDLKKKPLEPIDIISSPFVSGALMGLVVLGLFADMPTNERYISVIPALILLTWLLSSIEYKSYNIFLVCKLIVFLSIITQIVVIVWLYKYLPDLNTTSREATIVIALGMLWGAVVCNLEVISKFHKKSLSFKHQES